MHKLLTYQEAAEFLGVPVATLYSWTSLKKVPHIRLSRRMVRFDQAALEAWVTAHAVEAEEATDGR